MENNAERDPVLTGLKIDYRSGRPVYSQIVDGIKALIYGSGLKPGFQLPTVRALAGALDINPNTVARAYRELEYEGVLSSRVGRGTFVARFDSADGRKVLETRLKDLDKEIRERCLRLGLTREQFMDYIRKEHGGEK